MEDCSRRRRSSPMSTNAPDDAILQDSNYKTAYYKGRLCWRLVRNCPRLTLAQALSSGPMVAAIRVNRHSNVVAVDVTSQNCLKQLLTLTELKGIPVTARQPAVHQTSMGFLRGVDSDAAGENLLSGLQSEVRVLSATREGRTITLRFEGPVPQDHMMLFREQRRLATIMAYSTSAFSRRAVTAVLREETREVQSYTRVVKGHAAPARSTPAQCNLRRPLPVAATNTPAVSAAPAAPAVQPPLHVSTPAAAAPKTQPAEDGTKAWRLLMVPRIFKQVMSLAIHLSI
ncbi:hypothetical protein MRX96_021078 [Rhipicephalus microplus]